MPVGLLSSPEDLIDMLEDKIRHGWILVFGDSRTLPYLEYGVYPPGTPANADFGMFMLPCFPPRSLFIARKTPKLREFLQWEKHGLSQRDWDTPFILELLCGISEEDGLARMTIMPSMKQAVHFIEALVREAGR